MRLSIIIVSYNVYPFLDNCLRSVIQALKGIDGEIIVVDNASVDRTPELLLEHFREVRVIVNHENYGFAKANNQAIKLSQGEYVLLLNPDTIVSENTFSECIAFMDAHPEAGALGVRMIDGSGRYLPESKRGLPTLKASFMKMTGLYRLFPRSRNMNSYYQGHVGEQETARIQILSGAFMWLRKESLHQAGLLDEEFFMYGEDIDLSYRITKAGYEIYYLPTTSIIHYKGESTKKSSLNYLMTFYQAMLIFIRKHPEFKGQQFLIKIAIYFHGFVRLLRRLIVKWWPPLMDAVIASFSFYLAATLWARYYHQQIDYFKSSFYAFNIPLYTIISITALYLNGAYDKPFLKRNSWIGFGWAVLFILVIYAMLPVDLRTSRMVILLGAFLFMVFIIFTRWKFEPWRSNEYSPQEPRKAVFVSGKEELKRIQELINRSHDQIEFVAAVNPVKQEDPLQDTVQIKHLADIIRVHQVKEIIFSAQDVPFSEFTAIMSRFGPGIRYMLAASTTMNIVGSMSSDTEGESYGIRVDFKLTHPSSQRAKRIFDILISLFILLLSPILVILISVRTHLFQNIFSVLAGRKTWISYHPFDAMRHSLPALPQGILSPAYPDDQSGSMKRLEHIHYVYARDYHWTTDLAVIISQWSNIGRKALTYGK